MSPIWVREVHLSSPGWATTLQKVTMRSRIALQHVSHASMVCAASSAMLRNYSEGTGELKHRTSVEVTKMSTYLMPTAPESLVYTSCLTPCELLSTKDSAAMLGKRVGFIYRLLIIDIFHDIIY